jgi:hypothetical protein
MSVLRINSGAPESINTRSRNSEYKVRISASVFARPPLPDGKTR